MKDWVGLDWRVEKLDWIRLEDWRSGRVEDKRTYKAGIGSESLEDFGIWEGLGSLESWES